MKEQQYYEEIEHLIKRNEISKRARKLEENYSLVETYWHIGKIIVDAQGGSSRAKYGNELIKKWSVKLTELYGKGYDYTNLSRFRKFYMSFPILGTACQFSCLIGKCFQQNNYIQRFVNKKLDMQKKSNFCISKILFSFLYIRKFYLLPRYSI